MFLATGLSRHVRTCIALLRAINVGGHNRIPMDELRALCSGLGWSDVRSYIQSGNLVFRTDGAADLLERALEGAIAEHFRLGVPVLVRERGEWLRCVKSNPFGAVAEAEPNRVMMALSKRPPAPGAADRLQERAEGGEGVAQVGEALWIHFPGGAGRSKLTPALLDREVGSPVTTRNWRTVMKLREMADSVTP